MSSNDVSPRNRAERRLAGKKARTAGAVLTAGSAALAMGAAWIGTSGMQAAGAATTLHVTSTADSGAGTLRDQIAAAVDGDSIVFDVTGTITLTSGDISIVDDLTITGPGSSSLTISGNDASRIFDIGSATVTITGLTLTHGNETGVNEQGGALRADNSAVSLGDVVVSNSTAVAGGGGIATTGVDTSLSVTNSVVTGNSATGSTSRDGGGGVNLRGQGAQVTIANSVVSGNSATNRWAGGIYFYGNAGNLDIESTTISGNTTAQGGGGGWLGGEDAHTTVNNSTVSGNQANGDSGGGLYFYTDGVSVTGSTFTGNHAEEYGGGADFETNDLGVTITGSTFTGNDAHYGGGVNLYYTTGAVNITATTISGNTAEGGGGGVYAGNDGGSSPGSITVRDSTISGNSAGGWGGGFYLTEIVGGVQILNSTISGNTAGKEGGGIQFNGYYGLTLVQDTITDNTGSNYGGLYLPSRVGPAAQRKAKAERVRETDVDRPGNSERAKGSAVHSAAEPLDVDGETTIIGSIIWGNHGDSAVGTDVGPGGLLHVDHSLLGLVGPDTILDDLGGNLFKVDPLLGPLANNGGPTQTHELLTGSPAIDAGPVPASTSTAIVGDYDQREAPFSRVQFIGIDIGAFEVQAPQPVDIAPKFTG